MSSAGAGQILELLDSLKSAVRDFTAKENQLKQGHSVATAKLDQRFQEAADEQNARLSEEVARADALFEAGKQRIESQYSRRKSRISKAGKAAKQRRLGESEKQEGHRKFEIQRDLLETGRTKKEDLKREKEIFAAFTAHLAVEREALAKVERQAQNYLRGFGSFIRMLASPPESGGLDLSADENRLLEEFRARLVRIRGRLDRFRKSPLPLFFWFLPLWLWIALVLLVPVSLIPVLRHSGINFFLYVVMITSLGAVLVLYFLGRRLSGPAATAIATDLGQARVLCAACEKKSVTRHQQETERIRNEAAIRTQMLQDRWRPIEEEAMKSRLEYGRRFDEQIMRAAAKNEVVHRKKIERLEQEHADRPASMKREALAQKNELETTHAQESKQMEVDYHTQFEAMAAEWRSRLQPIYNDINAAQAFADKIFPGWDTPVWQQWSPPETFAHMAKFGEMEVDVEKLAGTLPQDERLSFPGPIRFKVPLMLKLPHQGSILFETKDSGRDKVIGTLNNIILRLLSVAPPGQVQFTIIDPVELGQDFAGLMHLADFEESLINSRIWTQTGQIEQQLANLNEHIEKVTQMYLRNEYATITEYNEQAGRIAEKYHFLVVADFPVNFSELAVKRLLSIAASGPRCGVYTLIHWDQRRPVSLELVPDELRKNSLCLQIKRDDVVPRQKLFEGISIRLDSPPGPDLATEFLQRVGRFSIDSNRVEILFEEVVPDESELWTSDTTSELRVPIGRTGATKQQCLVLGKDTRQHALIAGKTGSGKSTLFHVIITNLALWCSPEQVEFYLVDFKKGVEFKCYATHQLPHARVVAIESDREFGLSVLQRVDEELKRRGDLFRKLGVQDVAGYKKAGGTEPIPRTLLIIDEFQEFFVEDDRIAQSANLFLDRVVRQGRAFGIHVLLGSQTLGGAYTLARTTLGQMVVRIALQCNETDAYLIMDDNNAAPRLLSRPGEAIYNDKAGAIEGNSPFQVVWLPDEIRETYLDKVRHRADAATTTYPSPIVFEGNAPANIGENNVLRGLLEAKTIKPVKATRAWLGAPNSIKGPTEAVFRQQSGNNLLIVGQRDEAALTILGVSLVALAAQHPRGTARFVVFDCTPPDSPHREFLEKIVQAIPHEISLLQNADIETIMASLASDAEKRSDPKRGASAPATYLFIHGLQRFKKFRYDEDVEFSLDATKAAHPGSQLNKLICEGTSLGFHVICTCDTANNVNRFLSRKAVSEFEMRVVFQISASDSASLIDSPKAGNLGLHRAIYYNEQEGYLETFRPYALPSSQWISEAAANLSRLLG